MTLESILNGPALLAIVGVLALAFLAIRPRRRPAPPTPSGPTGVGAALAFALDGDLPRARALLTRHVQASGAAGPDAVLGLVAVLRAQRDFARAAAIVRGLRARQRAAWLDALCVRLCLDAGQPTRAAGFVDAQTPRDLAVAALVRAGRWSDALARLGRQRPAVVEAAIQAGWAAQLLINGEDRAGRKRLKRSTALAADSVAVLVVSSHFAARESDREAADRALAQRIGRTLDPSGDIDPATRALLDATEAQAEDGAVEAALGALRDALDREPSSEPVRRAYEQLILEHGEPEDWRTALAERTEAAPAEPSAPPVIGCGACQLKLSHVVFICPRCDRFDTVAILAQDAAVGVEPASHGARVTDLVDDPRRSGARR